MATLKVDWKQTGLISVLEESQGLGFDLRKFDRLHEDVQASLKKATVARILKVIRDTWDKGVEDTRNKHWFGEVRNGIYVISIGHGFGVSYARGCSEIMYIGRGKISTRLRTHLHNWIFDMSRSLRDVPFKFYMEEFGDGRSPDAFKDFEHWLLEEFHEKFGEKPLLNKIAGREGTIDHAFTGNCNAPLDNRGKTFLWQIRPSEKNPWFKPVADD
ncbi:GIY-YIG nuclease family protein [Sphingomonas parapaucimobilis]|nr:GIY-YIG nuclease family protein [Sphingomonas parapaucimobilis]